MERGSSAVECWTRNLVSPGSNSPLLCHRFEDREFSLSPLTAIGPRHGGNVNV